MEGCGHIKYCLGVPGSSWSPKTDSCMFAMETTDHNIVFDMEKSITLLLARNHSILRQEYKVPQAVVKQKRFHDYLITLEVKPIKISSVNTSLLRFVCSGNECFLWLSLVFDLNGDAAE